MCVLSRSFLELEALLAEFLTGLLDLAKQLVVRLIAVPKGKQVPSDVDQCAAAEHDDGVEG